MLEGFFDCLRVHQADFPCVALMGAVLSTVRRELATRRFRSVILLLDGDQTGPPATARVAAALRPVCAVTGIFLAADYSQMKCQSIRFARYWPKQKGVTDCPRSHEARNMGSALLRADRTSQKQANGRMFTQNS
jgi:hypothetical protein